MSDQEALLEDLKDHEEAVASLNTALEESKLGDLESQEPFLQAFRNISEA